MVCRKIYYKYDYDAVDLPQPLKSGAQFKFSIKWWYNINNHGETWSFWI